MSDEFKLKLLECDESDLQKVGFDGSYLKKGLEKHKFLSLKIYGLTCAQANILKQTALSSGTDCAVHREVITGKVELSDCILSGSINHFRKIAQKLKLQPFKLTKLSEKLINLIDRQLETLAIRNTQFNWSEKTYIMGILNATPDSFSDGGLYNDLGKAISHYKEMVSQGADIIDIGGESTRPYSEKISPEEELKRVVPLIAAIREFDKTTIISIDTRNAITAKKALESGADIINDVSSGDWDDEMFNVIIEKGCPIILNHSSASPDIMQNKLGYNDLIDDIYEYLYERIKKLEEFGVTKSKIIVDPGIGFGKDSKHNFEIIKRIKEFNSLGCPVLVGHSRKNFIKETIQSDKIEDLDIATVALSAKLIEEKVNIIRVHDVKKHKILNQVNSLLF